MPAFELAVAEELRPRVSRTLGIPLEWDVAIDALSKPSLRRPAGILAAGCRLYRRIRPTRIGNRCAFEPSCSRFAELSFRLFGARVGVKLTATRLYRCKACNGGLDLPPMVETSWLGILEERVCSIA